MRKKTVCKKKVLVLACMMVLLVSVFGCGSASKGDSAVSTYGTENGYAAAEDGLYYESSEEIADMGMDGAGMDTGSTDTGSQETSGVADSSRKLIKTVDLSAETYEFDALSTKIQNRIQELGGYMESMSVSTSYDNLKYGDFTIRIPADKLDSFVNEMSEETNITNHSEYVEDVTLSYVDMESHKAALEAEEESLLQLLSQAQSVEDIIVLQSRLTEVRYQIESMESQLRTYDNLVEYGTLHLYIYEVKTYTPVEEESFWSRISTGFVNSLKSVGTGFKNFAIGFVIALPHLFVWAVIIGAIALVVRAIVKSIQKKEEKKKKDKQDNHENKDNTINE